MSRRRVSYQKKYGDIIRPKMPITILPAHYFNGWDKVESGTRRWWLSVPPVSRDEEDGGCYLDETELRALALAVEAALDDADRSMEVAIREHNGFVEATITDYRKAKEVK